MANWSDIRTAIATTLSTVVVPLATPTATLRVFDYAKDGTGPPVAFVNPGPGQFLRFGPVEGPTVPVDFTAVVELFVARGTARTGQDQLDGFLATTGVSSIYATIDAAHTLGGVVSYCYVDSAGGYTMASLNGVDVFGVQFMLSGSV